MQIQINLTPVVELLAHIDPQFAAVAIASFVFHCLLVRKLAFCNSGKASKCNDNITFSWLFLVWAIDIACITITLLYSNPHPLIKPYLVGIWPLGIIGVLYIAKFMLILDYPKKKSEKTTAPVESVKGIVKIESGFGDAQIIDSYYIKGWDLEGKEFDLKYHGGQWHFQDAMSKYDPITDGVLYHSSIKGQETKEFGLVIKNNFYAKDFDQLTLRFS